MIRPDLNRVEQSHTGFPQGITHVPPVGHAENLSAGPDLQVLQIESPWWKWICPNPEVVPAVRLGSFQQFSLRRLTGVRALEFPVPVFGPLQVLGEPATLFTRAIQFREKGVGGPE